MRILITGSEGTLAKSIISEFKKKEVVVVHCKRTDIDFNYQYKPERPFENIDGIIINHGEYFDKLESPELSLKNFCNTRRFVNDLISLNNISFVSFVLSDCNIRLKPDYEWYTYNKILLNKFSEILELRDLVIHRYFPTRMDTKFHEKFKTFDKDKKCLDVDYLAQMIAKDSELDHSTNWAS